MLATTNGMTDETPLLIKWNNLIQDLKDVKLLKVCNVRTVANCLKRSHPNLFLEKWTFRQMHLL